MKHLLFTLAALFAMPLFAAEISTPSASASEEFEECFTKERVYKEDVPWNKYYSPQFVSVAKDGTVAIKVQRTPGGPVGGMIQYYVNVNQKEAGEIIVSAESRASGFKGKDGYPYRLSAAFRTQAGGTTKEDHTAFPGTPDGKWHRVEKRFKLAGPVKLAYIHVSLCYRDGEAEFRNLSVKVAKSSLAPFKAMPVEEKKK